MVLVNLLVGVLALGLVLWLGGSGRVLALGVGFLASLVAFYGAWLKRPGLDDPRRRLSCPARIIVRLSLGGRLAARC